MTQPGDDISGNGSGKPAHPADAAGRPAAAEPTRTAAGPRDTAGFGRRRSDRMPEAAPDAPRVASRPRLPGDAPVTVADAAEERASGGGFGAAVTRLLGRRPDETVLRVVFGAMLSATVVVVGGDMLGLSGTHPAGAAATPDSEEPARPFLPTASPVPPGGVPDSDRGASLAEPMRFDLGPDGRLTATGTITPGTAARLEEELAARGGYVTTVVLDSPGGSVRDAIAMGQLIRGRGYDTVIGPGGYCASSCPLVFAGGVGRHVSSAASVGVHQVLSLSEGPADPARDMNEVQRVSAECQRHLYEMGVDPRVWMHAMETPFESLFYFAGQELVELKLATAIEG